MTRINSAISVKNLTDEHLLAEHREIKRLPRCLVKAISSGSIARIPKEFTLGTGHVLFFLDKMKFICKRYEMIYKECLSRGINVTSYKGSFDIVFKNPEYHKYFNDYVPTDREKALLVSRITDRITASNKLSWHFASVAISPAEAIDLLK